jgi:cytochrome P450
MRVIGMLLGIPEADQEEIRLRGDARLRREPGQPSHRAGRSLTDPTFFGGYLDWRARNPSDDLMTGLLAVEFEDEAGAVRRLTRDEVLTFVNVLASAGNEPTNRLIGWTGKVLADHPDQQRELVDDRSLLAGAVEETLRFEPPSINGCRYVARDVEVHGRTVPAGSAMLLLRGAANHDERAFPPAGDVFDIHRSNGSHVTFGYGIHFCFGAAPAPSRRASCSTRCWTDSPPGRSTATPPSRLVGRARVADVPGRRRLTASGVLTAEMLHDARIAARF